MDGLLKGNSWRNSSSNPCTSYGWSPMLAFYCPVSCPLYPQLAPPPPPGTISDEADPQGATSLNRQLASIDTVSRGGMRAAKIDVTYMDGLSNATAWYPVFRTFVNGSDDNTSLYSGASIDAVGNFDKSGSVCKIGSITAGDAETFSMLDRIKTG